MGARGLWMALVLVGASGASAQRYAAVPLKTFTDPVGGVTLRYPAVWTESATAASYFPAVIAPNNEPLVAAFEFSPVGNYYAPTTLTGLAFLYRRVALPSEEACLAIVRKSANAELAKPASATIHGVRYVKLVTGEAGMSKAASETAFATWRGGMCYLFEADVNQVGAGVEPGKDRQLTAAELHALDRHLNDVMLSVRYGPGGR